MPHDLSSRTVLVTGASSGIGARLAMSFAAAGARVALAARRADRLATLHDAICDAGGEALAVSMDVADETSTVAAYDEIEQRLGPVDSVVANAGISIPGPALDLAIADFDAMMAANVRGVFLTVREGARRMIAAGAPERQHGRITIMSSITAQAINAQTGAYSASKAAVLQLGRVLARDWARLGINVNILCPGYIETELTSDWFSTDGGKYHIATWPRRRLLPEDSLDAIALYLASDASAYVTGSVFTIDDGQSL